MTSTRITSYGHWLPDGRQVAFNVDAGSTCTSAGCPGKCEICYAPANARKVNPLPSSPGEASRFRVRDGRGGTTDLACELLAWLR